jgi:subtilisin family serine protease
MTATSVGAQTIKTAETGKGIVKETIDNDTKEKNYAEGEAIILYKNNNVGTKSIGGSKALGGDLRIVETYDFDNEAKAGIKSVSGGNGISVSLVKSDKYSTKELVAKLREREDIQYAEPNYKIKLMDVSDPYKKYQWAIDNIGQNGGTKGADINADAIGNPIDDEEKVIALVDTGIDYTHEELKNVVWNNPVQSKQFKGLHGYDFINNDEDPMDDHGHGTHCSGIMAATANNGEGITGTVTHSNIKIMGLKVFDEDGYGYGMEAVGAYNYIYRAQQKGVNVVAVNNSWGALVDEDMDEDGEASIMKRLIDMIGEKGALTICAAGNEMADIDDYFVIPSNIDSPYVVSVAASNEKDELAGFSNYGKENVDIAAPGTDILSTVSYNKFNPILYNDKNAFCQEYKDFETGKLVQIIDEDSYTGKTLQAGDIAYGFGTSEGEADINVSLSDEAFFGIEDESAKSLKWEIKGAKEGDTYLLYLPYQAQVSNTELYSSAFF